MKHCRQNSGKRTKTCQRCGTCCLKGGPTLHASDFPLIQEHRLALGDLIAIRLGEPVFSPLVDGIEPARAELIKISGQNDSWSCRFFDQTKSGCGIYEHRPLECRLLKCWEPSELTNVIYRQCLKRLDVLPEDEQMRELIEVQDEHCGFAAIASLALEITEKTDNRKPLAEIARIVTLDLKIRQRAIRMRGLSLAEELLFFGRPLFKSLAYYRLTCHEGPQGLMVQAPSLGA